MREWLTNAHRLRQMHIVATVAWMVIGVPAAWFITYVMPEPHAAFAILVVSLYANAATHLSAYGAARAEESSGGGPDASATG